MLMQYYRERIEIIVVLLTIYVVVDDVDKLLEKI